MVVPGHSRTVERLDRLVLGYPPGMSRQHLRHQAGGDPAQGPHPDVANPTPPPTFGEEFPDSPDEPVAERPPDQPDLDAFARRMGTDRLAGRDSAGSTDRPSLAERARNWREPASGAIGGMSRGAKAAAARLGSLAVKLRQGSDEPLDLDGLRERVAGVSTVMVTTIDEAGTLSSRPVTVQEVDDSGDVWFVVDRHADWVHDGVDAVNVAFVDDGATWVSVGGRAALDDDTERLRRLWGPGLDAWFPDGPTTDGVVALHVQADRWEYWTAPNQIARLVGSARATVTDAPPDLGHSGAVET